MTSASKKMRSQDRKRAREVTANAAAQAASDIQAEHIAADAISNPQISGDAPPLQCRTGKILQGH